MPKNKMVKSLKNVLCEDSKAIKKMTKKKLVKFINKKFSSEMSSIDFSLHENLLHELQTRNKTVTNLNKGFLKKKLYEELLSEKALAEKEKIYRSDVQNQLNSEKSIFVLREKLKSLLANRYRRQAVDLGVAEILNIRNTKQTFNIIGFRLELFFLMVEETRRRFMERFFKAKRPLKLLNLKNFDQFENLDILTRKLSEFIPVKSELKELNELDGFLWQIKM
ncbi:hypothetical protein MHBO_003102 [Bonamia ostreae]|uniref:Uncharacterized protein n=1 Tax=Bonamia ostreae TaxID=126728 RepID=A0ABV2AQ26_9EUKA